MDTFLKILNILTHIDVYLAELVSIANGYAYLILFIIVFCETGLFMAPFLPEESLLFVTGTIASKGALNIYTITLLLMFSNVLGESLNYYIGKKFGTKIFKNNNSIIFNKKHIDKAKSFYDHHGGKTIIIGKYVPIIRTFIPFIAGVAKVKFGTFLLYNMIGGIPWVALFLIGGYLFGNIPIVSNNFSLVILFIIIISILPGIITSLSKRKNN